MGYGKSKESAAQERKNLLGINAVDNRATSFGGSWMSKHSIAKSGSNSPLRDAGHGGAEGHEHSTMENIKNYVQNSSLNNFRIKSGGTGDLQSQRRGAKTKPFGSSRQDKFKTEQTIKKNKQRAEESKKLRGK